ncbi:predicted protein [Uncinocarpus reesii 1704]|uniref:Protein kinase domain-containing protein n=1 Tax=Uncinocarpus reesii (strain UAMH 1704) TaxID=336963 RepID=C4JLP7_UNCRE|nr:uncharacterized protein UREG_03755 [Uncinocarpus reesii 1704]EEP78909.1 predicted protein [Uncinocarpus reesii 1704]
MAGALSDDCVDTPQEKENTATNLISKLDEGASQSALSMRRYVPVAEGLDVEDFAGYKQGGYHPTHIGDTLDNGRFRIIHKVGYSSRSFVWLARDLWQESKLVTIKVLIAEISSQCKEDRILALLHSEEHGVENIHVPRLLHKFTIVGPNGTHVSLVLPLIGPTISEYSDAQVKAGLSPYLPSVTAVDFSRQIVGTLAHLHSCGITHGDLKPQNILVSLRRLDALSDQEIYSYLGKPRQEPLHTANGEPAGPSAPKYGVVKANLADFGLEYLTDTVNIADFLDAFSIASPSETLTTTLGYAAPETLLEHKISRCSDVWSLGCTLFEIRFLHQLFPTCNDSRDIMLQNMVKTLGKPPEHQWQHWENRGEYFLDNGAFDACANGRSLLGKRVHNRTAQSHAIGLISEDESKCFEDLLWRMLQYEPTDRITAVEALNHPWLRGEFSGRA